MIQPTTARTDGCAGARVATSGPLQAAAGPVTQGGVRHRVTVGSELLAQLSDGDLAVVLVDEMLQPGAVNVEVAGAGGASGDHVLPSFGPREPLHSVTPQPRCQAIARSPMPSLSRPWTRVW